MTAFMIITAIILAALDQVTKIIAVSAITKRVNVLSVGDTEILSFSLYHNDGAAFSSFQGRTAVLAAVTALMMAALVCAFIKMKPSRKFPAFCAAMVIGGGVGNLIDRIRLGYVVDFIELFPFNFIFNVADICVVVGAILLVIYYLFFDKESKNPQQPQAAEERDE